MSGEPAVACSTCPLFFMVVFTNLENQTQNTSKRIATKNVGGGKTFVFS